MSATTLPATTRSGSSAGPGVDVVHLPRVERMMAAFGSTLLARLHHVDDLEAASIAPTPYSVGMTLAVKEAWIKLHGGRPSGWRFTSTRQEAVEVDEVDSSVRRPAADLATDLGVGPLEWVRLITPQAVSSDDYVAPVWACVGTRGEWLVAGAFR